jgi:hypothetical protein
LKGYEEKMLGKIYTYVKRRKEIVASFKRNTKYLCAGTYVFNDTINFITRNDSYTKKRTYELFQNNYYINGINRFVAGLLKYTFYRKSITVPEQEKQFKGFSGTVYLPVRSTNGYSDKKIFDFSRNQVLSIFTNEKDYKSYIQLYETFKDHFCMPTILWTSDEDLLIMEELIINLPNNTWEKDDFLYVMQDIYDRYYDYFNVCKTKGISSFITPKYLLASLPKGYEISLIKSKINSELFDLKIPCLKLHGDLWTSNILLVKAEEYTIHYIDWEWSNEFLFFYDLFMMMWNEVILNNNYIYIEKYAKGEYDPQFTKIFSVFDLSFQTQFRLDYLNIFFINFFKEKWVHLEKNNKTTIFNQYRNLMEKIEIGNF